MILEVVQVPPLVVCAPTAEDAHLVRPLMHSSDPAGDLDAGVDKDNQ